MLSSTFNTTTEVPLSKAPNPQLLPGRRSINGCPLLRVFVHGVCVCSLLCVCTLDGLNAEHKFEYGLPYLAVCHVTNKKRIVFIVNLCSAINPSKVHTHSSEHTHTVNKHQEHWASIYAAPPGEQLGVRCLAQGHLSRGIEGGRERCTLPTYNSCQPETRTRNLWVTSPSL